MQNLKEVLLNQMDEIIGELSDVVYELQTQQGIGMEYCQEKLEEVQAHYQQIQDRISQIEMKW